MKPQFHEKYPPCNLNEIAITKSNFNKVDFHKMPYQCEANKIVFIAKHGNKIDFHQPSFKKRQIEDTKDVKYAGQSIIGYHPEIETTRDIDVPAIGMRHGHQGTSSGNVTARICPKASAPSTIEGAPASNTKKQKAIIANTKAKTLAHTIVLIARSLKPK